MMKKLMMASPLLNLAGVLGAMASALSPNAMESLPAGAIRPAGWLKHQLDLMTEGLCGRLYETSECLTSTNGWLQADGVGWEGQPCWFRAFVPLGCPRCRLLVLPQATDYPLLGYKWKVPPAKTLSKDRPKGL